MSSIIEVSSEREFIDTICKLIKDSARENIEKKGCFTFVLSGGRTPKAIFQELAANYQTSIEWGKVHFFWLDERCVEPTHKDSNYKLAYDYLLSKLRKIGSVHRIKCELGPYRAAKAYKKEIISFFGNYDMNFDFILLGIGEDGHCASLFPHSRELKEKEEIVIATEKPHNGSHRVTLTLPLINRSNKILMINSKKKHDIYNSDGKLPINFVAKENMTVIIFKKIHC